MATDTSRLPQVWVTASGITIGNVVGVNVQSNSFLGADRFRVSLVFDPTSYYVWESDDIDVTVSVCVDSVWQELIRGPVDKVEVDLETALIHVDGRDMTARLIEAQTQETFENQTASDVANTLASRRGLTPNVTPTTTLIGRNYGGDHARVTLNQYSSMTTEWDLLTKLAYNEGFDVWVDGQILNFAPPLTVASPVVVRPTDCQSIRLDRALALSAGLNVTVKSWDCRAHASVSQLAGAGENDSSQSFVIVKPNLTAWDAAQLAQRVYDQMSQNARVVTIEWPGELTIKPRQSLLLADTNTDFDGQYVVTSIERALSFGRGFTETLQARIPSWTIS